MTQRVNHLTGPLVIEVPDGDIQLEHNPITAVSLSTPHPTQVEKMALHTFKKVETALRKSGICPACGNKATRSHTIWQTLNPFNTNAEGKPKSVAEIRAELAVKGKAWKDEPVYHQKCEP